MNHTDKTHEDFRKSMQDEDFVKNLQQISVVTKLMLENGLKQAKKVGNQKVRIMYEWSLEMAKEFYCGSVPGDGLIYINRNRLSGLWLGYVKPNVLVKPCVKTNQRILEINNVNSLKKGEGYKIMTRVIGLADKLFVPICLWTEKDSLVTYYERYGFKNFGRRGENDEYLMIRFPKKIKVVIACEN